MSAQNRGELSEGEELYLYGEDKDFAPYKPKLTQSDVLLPVEQNLVLIGWAEMPHGFIRFFIRDDGSAVVEDGDKITRHEWGCWQAVPFNKLFEKQVPIDWGHAYQVTGMAIYPYPDKHIDGWEVTKE